MRETTRTSINNLKKDTQKLFGDEEVLVFPNSKVHSVNMVQSIDILDLNIREGKLHSDI